MSLLRRHSLLGSLLLEPETIATVARMSNQPSLSDKLNYNQWIREIKIGHGLALGKNNLSTIFRLLALNAGHHVSVPLINWAIDDAALDGSYVGTIGFTAYEGTYSNASSMEKYPQDVIVSTYIADGCFGFYKKTDVAEGNCGSVQTNGNANMLLRRSNTGNTVYRFQCVGGQNNTLPLGNPGVFAVKRIGSTVSFWHKDIQRASATPTLLSTVQITEGLGINAEKRQGESGTGFMVDTVSCSFYGLGSINTGIMNTAIENFLNKYI
jgi:hypothetical protein